MKPSDRSDESRKTIARLKMLVKASELLNSSLDLDRILDVLLKYTVTSLNATRGTIYLFDKAKGELSARRMRGEKLLEIRLAVGEGIAGHVAKSGKTVRIADAYKDKRFFSGVDRKTGFKTRSMLCAPMKNKSGKLVGVFQILNKRRGTFTKEDERFLSSFSIPATIAIENARLHQTEIETERMRRDLELAAALQQQILPQRLPQHPSLQLEAMTRPCRTVGGDFYDAFEDNQGNITIVVADASGKGIGAALLVSTFQAALHTYVEFGLPLPEIAAKLNRIFYEDSIASSFVTCVLASLDVHTGTLRYVNAGHNSPLLLNPAREFLELHTGGIPLGMIPDTPFEEGRISLGKGDFLVMYTDGLTEAMDPSGALYGEERMRSHLTRLIKKALPEISRVVCEDVVAYTGTASQTDDMTLLMLRMKE